MNGYACHLIDEVGTFALVLRRYRPTKPSADGERINACPAGHWYCNARTGVLETLERDDPRLVWSERGGVVHGDVWPHDDPRWPTVCAHCGGAFTDDDEWQARPEAWYCVRGTDELVTLDTARPGAMRLDDRVEYWPDASVEYLRDHASQRGLIFVKLPDGVWWSPDRACTGSRSGWTVTGEAPLISVTPSILHHGSYHGWLGTSGYPPGVLSRDIDNVGRPY